MVLTKKKLQTAAISLVALFLVFELIAGYALFWVSWGKGVASTFFLRKLFNKDEPTMFAGRLDVPQFNELSTWDENPFLSFNGLSGYRYHPFIDYSGVHGMYPQDIKLDYFGFRNEKDFYFSAPHCQLVVLTGGSEAAGFSHHVPISKKMERMLNQGSKQRFCVLNLAMNSYTLPNEMAAYLHLAFHLKPQFVISHSAANDIGYGAWSPVPFKKLGLAYLKQLEHWLPRLYNLNPGFNSTLTKTHAGDEYLVSSYLENASKFSKVVGANGGRFILGIQGVRDPDPSFSKLMEDLNRAAKMRPIITFQDNPKIQYVDEIHTTEDSGDEIAAVYAGVILKKVKGSY